MSHTQDLPPTNTPVGLVGDIGGTNCRLALATAGAGGLRLYAARTLKNADYPTSQDGIGTYLKDVGVTAPAAAVIAVAGPVRNGSAHLTNAQWQLNEANLQTTLGIGTVRLINDFAAQAYSAPLLGPSDLAPIGPPIQGRAGGTIAIMGPGTGFGLAALAGGTDAGLLVTEAGHIGFAPTTPEEIGILRILLQRHGRVSVERVLSGHGMENLHSARAELAGAAKPTLDAAGITEAAESGDADAVATVELFCDIMASVAGDFALAYGAEGGIFLGGGIMPRLLPRLDHARFRARFETKGRFVDYLRAIPTHVVTAADGSLRGSAHAWATLVAKSA